MLKNKVVVITGGAGLLGKEFATAVLENNGIAIIADLDADNGLKAANLLKELFPAGTIDFQPLNISNKQSILSLIEILTQKYNRIDALVNSAYPRNKSYGRKFEDVTYEDFCENITINLGGYFLTSQQFLKYFCRQGFGNIINIASVYGVIAPRFEIYDNTSMTMPVEYAAIKSALIHLTKYMAKYYKGKNIRINAISPGGVLDTQPAAFLESYKAFCLNKGILDKSDINGTLVYLLSDLSLFVNGQNIVVDDGFTL
jgi:NAD(P)-dependent dehydrogenase (short-subunit alcohol dehydrogenase family)